MDIKYKLYPYPVLAEYYGDYKESHYSVSIDMVKDGYNLRIDFDSELTSSTLKQLIEEGKVSYVYHLECAQTGFRHVIITRNEKKQYVIDKRMICGSLHICPFIVANEDIHNFTSQEFHDDYAGISFEIEAGCVMAVGKQINFDIYKEVDDIAKLPSIFSIVRNPDVNIKEMLVDYESKKIIIKLPFNEFATYKQLYNNPSTHYILNSLTIVPALTYIIEEIKMRSEDTRYELETHMWYRTIKKVLQKNFDIDIESEECTDNLNALEYAQKLINSPISDAFNSLYSFGGSEVDE